MQQPGLLQHHLRSHADQLAIMPQRQRLAGQADHPDDVTINAQRQVNARPHAMEMFSHGLVDVDNASLREHQQRTFVQLPNTFPVTAADNPAPRIHHVDIAVNNFHGARHDILCQPGIKMIGSHPLLLKKRGEKQNTHAQHAEHCAIAQSQAVICRICGRHHTLKRQKGDIKKGGPQSAS